MRWHVGDWLRSVAGRDGPEPVHGDDTPSAPEPAQAPGPGGERSPAAWRDLPQLQRAVGSAPLTAPSVEFARGLAGRRSPDPMLAPLGHDVRVDGPAGLVSGIAVPLVQRALPGPGTRSFPALPPTAAGRGRSTAQRTVTTAVAWPRPGSAPGPGAEAGPDAPTDARSGTGPPDEELRLDGKADEIESPAAGEAVADLPSIALRALPVARLATVTPALSATRVADATAPSPVLALAPHVPPKAVSGGHGAPSATADSPSAVAGPPPVEIAVIHGATERASAPVPGTHAAAPPTSAPAASAQPALAGGDDPARPVVARRTLGESRRLGLGAPLAGRPPSAPREDGRSGLPVARLARTTEMPGSLPTSQASTPPAPASAPEPVAAAAPPALPRLVVARRSTTTSGTVSVALPLHSTFEAPASPGAPTLAAEGAPVDPAPDDAGADGSSRPLVGSQPLGVSWRARGDSAEDADGGEAGEPGDSTLRLAGATHAVRDAAGVAAGTAPGAPGADPAGEPATHSRPGSFGTAAVQRSQTTEVREPSRVGGPGPGRPAAPAVAPLVIGRAMRASAPVAPTTLGTGPAAKPVPAVARLAISTPAGPGSLGGLGDPGAAGPAVFGGAARPGTPLDPVGVVRQDGPVMVARAALALDRAPASASRPAASPWRPGVATGTPDASGTSGQGGVITWTAEAGFATAAPSPMPFVQRAVTIDEVSVAPGGQSAGAPGGTAGQTGALGAGGGSGTDLEELAEHLYDRIRARLTNELLLDRERAGLLVDG